MDRNLHKKYYPQCPNNFPQVDQYMFEQPDTNTYTCINGLSNAIYNCDGTIHYSLPLDKYPLVNEIHEQIPYTRRMHLTFRDNPSLLVEGNGSESSNGRSGRNGIREGYLPPGPDFRDGYYLREYSAVPLMRSQPNPFLSDLSNYVPHEGRPSDYDGFPYDIVTPNMVPGYPLPDPYRSHYGCRGNTY